VLTWCGRMHSLPPIFRSLPLKLRPY